MERAVHEPRSQGRFAIVRHGEIRDQRFNNQYYGALFGGRGPVSGHEWSRSGLEWKEIAWRETAAGSERATVFVDGGLGKRAYHAGPRVIVIDPLGLADPLLARLPDADRRIELIGHLERRIPKGYVEARRGGDLSAMHPSLRAYYEPLREITRGPLWSWDRVSTAIAFNLGRYDPLLDAYLAARK